MSETKTLAASIVKFLKQQLDNGSLSADARESVEVAAQCVETAFELTPEELARGLDLALLARQKAAPANRAEAEKLKNEGNELMKADKFREALEKYTRAIAIDPTNSVYFCNRAAAHFKLNEHEAAVADCTAALELQPSYGKAHGRLGIALTALDRHAEARAAFARAAALEPDNDSYRQNLRLAEERLAQRGDRPALDFGGLLANPTLLNMATSMLADPNMQNLISGLMASGGVPAEGGTVGVGGPGGPGGLGGAADAGGMTALLQAGQQLAQQMQATNPELVDQLRRRINPQPAPDNSQPPPAPPQQ